MGTPRYVWLPSSGVWACLPHSSDASPQAVSPSRSDQDHGEKRSHRKTGRASRERSHPALEISDEKQKSLTNADEDATLEDDLGFRDHAKKHDVGPNSSTICDPTQKKRRRTGSGRSMTSCSSSGGTEFEGSAEVGFGADDLGASMCAICLGNIEEARGAFLQWCMHRFCTHCIEEWSRVRRVCPLCKAEFSGWYHRVQSNSEFEERILPPVVKELNSQSTRQDRTASHANSRSLSHRFPRGQERGRGRRPLQPRQQAPARHIPTQAQAVGRLVPFPTQRSFNLPRHYQGARIARVNEEEAAARALRWRVSIYNKGLKARPFGIQRRSSCTQAASQIPDAKARAERRLEPWIRRELQVLLRESNPDLLVRLVLSLWFATEHELTGSPQQERSVRQSTASCRRARSATGTEGGEENAVKELERYLGDKAHMFWHELRCFAESPFTMKAYDTVVVYSRPDIAGSSTLVQHRRPSKQEGSADTRRRWDTSTSRGIPRPLELAPDSQESAHLDNHNQILRTGRQPHSQRHQDSLGLHQKDSAPGCAQSQASIARDLEIGQRKKQQRLDVLISPDDRWQMSYC